MGNKSRTLPVLGAILEREGRNAQTFADPFCGSAAVSWHIASTTNKAVISSDLQSYAVARAAAVVERNRAVTDLSWIAKWIGQASQLVDEVSTFFPNELRSLTPDDISSKAFRNAIERSRSLCQSALPAVLNKVGGNWPTTKAYGGHYFSPVQALLIDSLRQTLPTSAATRKIALAALIEAASKASASPGHTAQPFQPTAGASKFLLEAWRRDVLTYLRAACIEIASLHATTKGKAVKLDYLAAINTLKPGDLVFADPPYSDVQYSRFYHVLETIASGQEVEVSGIGRYPPSAQRPQSNFSLKTKAESAAVDLLAVCSKKEVNLVLTFPNEATSTGLKADDFVRFGRKLFSSVKKELVATNFSTLGGNSIIRSARNEASEAIICFRH